LAAGGYFLLIGMTGFAEDAKKGEGAAKPTEGDECYKFVAPLKAVMEVMDDVFYKMPDKIKGTSTTKYKDLENEALFVAEVANLATHVKEHAKDKEWLGMAEVMKSNALKMGEAAKKKDDAALKALHTKVEEACDSCHAKFRDV
jgi:ribosomal protein S15P/S13E